MGKDYSKQSSVDQLTADKVTIGAVWRFLCRGDCDVCCLLTYQVDQAAVVHMPLCMKVCL